MFSHNLVWMLCLALMLAASATFAQDSTFTYQGQLSDGGEPVTGNVSLKFRLFDQLTGGSEVALPRTRLNWPVEDGLFQVELDFGTGAFDGSPRFLAVEVNGALLAPRQRVTSTPYAILAGGLSDGAAGSSAVDPTQVQLRVSATCPQGQSIRVIDQNGAVTCEADDVGDPQSPREEEGLVRIVAISWVHAAVTDTTVQVDGERPSGLAIAFGRSVGDGARVERQTLNDHTVQVFIDEFDSNLFGVGEGGFRRIRINIDSPVFFEDYIVDGGGQIVELTTTENDLVTGIFLPLSSAILDRHPELHVMVNGNFVTDDTGRAVDAEHVRGQLPSGDRPMGVSFGVQGGRFESWLQVGTP